MNRFVEEFNPEPADIAVCGSMAHVDKMSEVIKQLSEQGYTVSTPDMTESLDWSTFNDQDMERKKGLLVRRHFANIAQAQAVLVCNYDKGEAHNYIGTNTLMEMTAAFVYGKPIYLLNPIPNQKGREEIIALSPIVIDGDTTKIKVATA